MTYRIEDLESLGEALRACLEAAGVKNTRYILEKCATAKGRAEFAKENRISEAHVLQCMQLADLLRVKGVGDGYAGLLVAAGVTSVAMLKTADAQALAPRLAAAKAKVKHVERLPNVAQVARWIEDAASLRIIFT